jgi:hypothetical protein
MSKVPDGNNIALVSFIDAAGVCTTIGTWAGEIPED